jgi:hypothetical protein
MLHAQEGAENVGIEGGRVALGGLLRHRTGLAFGSGAVYSHIQATEARDGLVDEAANIIFMADVSAPILCLGADLAKFSDQFLAGFVASARDNDARTVFRESQGGGPSNTREGAGDQNNGGIHSKLPRGQFMGQSELTGVRITPVKRALSLTPSDC